MVHSSQRLGREVETTRPQTLGAGRVHGARRHPPPIAMRHQILLSLINFHPPAVVRVDQVSRRRPRSRSGNAEHFLGPLSVAVPPPGRQLHLAQVLPSVVADAPGAARLFEPRPGSSGTLRIRSMAHGQRSVTARQTQPDSEVGWLRRAGSNVTHTGETVIAGLSKEDLPIHGLQQRNPATQGDGIRTCATE